MPAYEGNQQKYRPTEQRADTRRWSVRMAEYWSTSEGGVILGGGLIIIALIAAMVPIGALFVYLPVWLLTRNFLDPKRNLHDMPIRVPKFLKMPDGSIDAFARQINPKKHPEKLLGEGITYLGVDRQSGLQTYLTKSDDCTHMTMLGTTGSGKTVAIFSLIANQMIQNSGFIFVDAKGDIKSQKEVCKLLRRFGREDDLLSISFATSGRNFTEAQVDKPTNTMNIFAASTDGMIIETLVNMLDDSGGGNGDMWKSRAIALIGAETRPLTFLRDRGEINLSPTRFIELMELSEVERLAFDRGKDYPGFDDVLAPLRTLIISLPGYNPAKRARGEPQDQKTVEQFGYLTMQLTRVLNDLSYMYGHIFGVEQGDVDIVDVILNRRCMTILLPALERSLDSLNMLGRLIIGALKQMMAGSLGNQMEGVTRVTVESRPTAARNSFKIILDEVGYMMVRGMSVILAQARALNISMVLGSQSYVDLKKGSAEEAEAIWANTTVKVIGRLTESEEDETIRKVKGVAGQYEQMITNSHDYQSTDIGFKYNSSQSVYREMRSQINLQDLAGQQDGEFHVIIGKKFQGGRRQGVAVLRILGFYSVDGPETKRMYLNDLAPATMPDKRKFAHLKTMAEQLQQVIKAGELSQEINNSISQTSSTAKNAHKISIAEKISSSNEQNNIILFLEQAHQEVMAHADDYGSPLLVTELVLNRLAESLHSVFNSEVSLPANRRNTRIKDATDTLSNGFFISQAPTAIDANIASAISHNVVEYSYAFDRQAHEATLRHHYQLAEEAKQQVGIIPLDSVYADHEYLWESRKKAHYDQMYLNNQGSLPNNATHTNEMMTLATEFKERQHLDPQSMSVFFNEQLVKAQIDSLEQRDSDILPNWIISNESIKNTEELRQQIQKQLTSQANLTETIANDYKTMCLSSRASANIIAQTQTLDLLGHNRPLPPAQSFENLSDDDAKATYQRLKSVATLLLSSKN